MNDRKEAGEDMRGRAYQEIHHKVQRVPDRNELVEFDTQKRDQCGGVEVGGETENEDRGLISEAQGAVLRSLGFILIVREKLLKGFKHVKDVI